MDQHGWGQLLASMIGQGGVLSQLVRRICSRQHHTNHHDEVVPVHRSQNSDSKHNSSGLIQVTVAVVVKHPANHHPMKEEDSISPTQFTTLPFDLLLSALRRRLFLCLEVSCALTQELTSARLIRIRKPTSPRLIEGDQYHKATNSSILRRHKSNTGDRH